MGKNKKDLRVARRRNAELYPIYKMFSWDLLFFYSVEFLFYTVTKGVTASEVLMIFAIYLIFKVLCQLPAIVIVDCIGKRKSMPIPQKVRWLSTPKFNIQRAVII